MSTAVRPTRPVPPPRLALPPVEPQGGGVLTLCADLCVLAGAYVGAWHLAPQPPLSGPLALAAVACLWVLLGTWRTSHRSFLRGGILRGMGRIAWNYLVALALTDLLFRLLLPAPAWPGPFLAAHYALAVSGLMGGRFAEIQVARYLRRKTGHALRILFVGLNDRTRRLIRDLAADPDYHVEVVGVLDPDARPNQHYDLPVKGGLDKLPYYLYGGLVDEVVVTLPVRSRYAEAEEVLKLCSEAGIRAHVLTDLFNLNEPRREVADLGNRPTLAYARGPAFSYRLILKRYLDVAVSLAALVLLSPVMAVIALLIKLTSPGPVLFRQLRCGLHGRPFQLLKFRTMYVDAEKRKKELLPKNEVSGPVFKMRNDPRVTPVGRFLRKYSLDELPQLINVLKGEMSLVGPRPPIPEEVQQYNLWQLRRLSMRPGLTCLWQISGRNRIPFEEWMRLDLKYIDNWSLTLDFLILLKTIPVVLKGSGL